MIIGYKNNKYDRFILAFDEMFTQYKCRKDEDVSYHIPNFVTLQNGITVCRTDDNKWEVFNKNKSEKVDVIDDKDISFDMKLYRKGVEVFVARGKQLFSFRMKGGSKKTWKEILRSI